MIVIATPRGVLPEQTRARYPDEAGYVDRDGVQVFYEVYGEGDKTALLLPTWSIAHSRFWKLQIPYLARHFRVVAFDGRGGGRSDQPGGAHAYTIDESVADALGVMDATGTATATLKVSVLFFSNSVSFTVEKSLGGDPADPTFTDAISTSDWSEYVNAFAAV